MSTKPTTWSLFPDSILADMALLDCEECGAHAQMLFHAWLQPDCGLPDDDLKLQRITRLTSHRWHRVKASVLSLWTLRDGRLFNARQLRERAYVAERSRKARSAAETRWSSSTGTGNQSDTENSSQKFSKEFSRKHTKRSKKSHASLDAQGTENIESDGCERIAQASGRASPEHMPPHPHSPCIEEEEDARAKFNAREGAVARIVTAWNDMAATAGLAPLVGITPDQTESALARLGDYGEAAILDAIAKVPKTRFLMGGGDKRWKTNFAHLLRADTVRKIHAGEYFARSRGMADGWLDPDLNLDDPFGVKGSGR